MNIKLNEDKEFVDEMRQKLRENDGFCPCRLEKNEDTKCMCKEFRDQMKSGRPGYCHCGLYIYE